MADQRCKRCGKTKDEHTHVNGLHVCYINLAMNSPLLTFEPEDAAPAPTVRISDEMAPPQASGVIWLQGQAQELGEPVAQPGAGGEPTGGKWDTYMCEHGREEYGLQEKIGECGDAAAMGAESGGHNRLDAPPLSNEHSPIQSEPAAGQVGAEQWLSSIGLSHLLVMYGGEVNLATLLNCYAAHVTKGLEAERDKYQEWMNCGGCPTNDVCGSPDEPGHEIYGPYHRLPDGTFRCQIHYERELKAKLEALEARNLELMGADVQRVKDISRLTEELGKAQQHEAELMGELERATKAGEFSAKKLLEEHLASIATEKRLAEAEKALRALFEDFWSAVESARAALRPSEEQTK